MISKVSQGAQFLRHLFIGCRGLVRMDRPGLRCPLLELLFQYGCSRRLLGDEVMDFAGIGANVVQLRAGRLDVMVVTALHAPQGAPPKRAEGVRRFTISWLQ